MWPWHPSPDAPLTTEKRHITSIFSIQWKTKNYLFTLFETWLNIAAVITVVVKILFFENCSVLRRSTHLRSLSPKNTTQQEDKINRHFCATWMCVLNGYGAVSNSRQDLFSMLSVCEIRSEKSWWYPIPSSPKWSTFSTLVWENKF